MEITVINYSYRCLGRQCGLCQFGLAEGDRIVAGGDGGRTSTYLECSLSREMFDVQSAIYYEICRGACDHPDGWVAAFHANCHRLLEGRMEGYLKAAAYLFSPTTAESQSRYRWLLRDLESRWTHRMKDLPSEVVKLAPEIRCKIAEYLLCEYSTSRLSAICLSGDGDLERVFSLERDVWARYVVYEGVSYISSLSNTRVSDKERLVHSPTVAHTRYTVFFCEDHLGILHVAFSRTEEPPLVSENENIWWRSFRLLTDRLRGQTDGLKLRSLTPIDQTESTAYRSVSWARPQNPATTLRYHEYREGARPRSLRLSSFQINSPAVTAYSVCWNIHILGVFAHQPQEQPTFYRFAEVTWGRVLWLYAPIDQGELITEIWKRSGQLYMEFGLFFKTSRGRLCQFGPQWSRSWGQVPQWTLLDQPTSDTASISFDRTELGIHELAFETPSPSHPGSHPIIPQPFSQLPGPTSLQSYFYSSAVLDDIIDIRVCRCTITRRITGLLFHYTDRRQVYVGEIRMDCLGPLLRLSSVSAFWLGFVIGDQGVYVQSIEFDRPTTTSTTTWFKVNTYGLLEWWFSMDQCRVYHGGRASPATIL